MPARAIPTMTMRCGPGSSIRMPRSREQKPWPRDLQPRQPHRRTGDRGMQSRRQDRLDRAERAAGAVAGVEREQRLPRAAVAELGGERGLVDAPVDPDHAADARELEAEAELDPRRESGGEDGEERRLAADPRRLAERGHLHRPEVQRQRAVDAVGEDRQPAVADDRAGVEMGAHRARRQHADDDRRRRRRRAGRRRSSAGAWTCTAERPDGRVERHALRPPATAAAGCRAARPRAPRRAGRHEAIAQGVGGGRPPAPAQRRAGPGRRAPSSTASAAASSSASSGSPAAAQRRHDEVCVATDLPSHVTATVVPAARDSCDRTRASRAQTF